MKRGPLVITVAKESDDHTLGTHTLPRPYIKQILLTVCHYHFPGWRTNHFTWSPGYLRIEPVVKKVYRIVVDFNVTSRRWDVIQSSDLDTRPTWLTTPKEQGTRNKKQEGKYLRAFRNVTEGGWCRAVIYPQPVYPSFARLPDNNNVTSLSHLFFPPARLVQLTWSHIASSADSVKEDNNSGTTGGQRYIAREGYVEIRDLDRMHELLVEWGAREQGHSGGSRRYLRRGRTHIFNFSTQCRPNGGNLCVSS